MTTNKDFKRLVRARMRKTGEAYTTARARLLVKSRVAVPAGPPTDYARLAGKSDAAIKANTGCTWKRWVGALDYVGAHAWPHREIAKYVHDTYKVSDWWSQMVTVGYERIKGLRAIGQRLDGSFEATKSKVFAAAPTKVFRAWTDRRLRQRWLPDVDVTVRAATRGKSVRLAWPDQTSVAVWFEKKGAGKTQVALQHAKLPDKAAATRLKAFWTERLTALGELLA